MTKECEDCCWPKHTNKTRALIAWWYRYINKHPEFGFKCVVSTTYCCVISAGNDRYQDCYDEVESTVVRHHEYPSLGLRRGMCTYTMITINKRYIFV